MRKSAVRLHLGEAVGAVDRTVGLGLEGNLRLAAAGGTGRGEVFSGATGGILAGVAAGLAALGLILETSLCVEFLLTGRKHEFLAAFLAN